MPITQNTHLYSGYISTIQLTVYYNSTFIINRTQANGHKVNRLGIRITEKNYPVDTICSYMVMFQHPKISWSNNTKFRMKTSAVLCSLIEDVRQRAPVLTY